MHAANPRKGYILGLSAYVMLRVLLFCGSWLACDDIASVSLIHRVARIAGKPAPTRKGVGQKSFRGSSLRADSCSRNANTWSPQYRSLPNHGKLWGNAGSSQRRASQAL